MTELKVAHLIVTFQLMLSIEHSGIRTPSEKLVDGFLILAQTGIAENTDGEADIVSLCQRLQKRQS